MDHSTRAELESLRQRVEQLQEELERRRRLRWGVVLALAAIVPVGALAVPPTPTHSFDTGQIISAEEMNDNFRDLFEAVSALEGRVDTLDAAASQPVANADNAAVAELARTLSTDNPSWTGDGWSVYHNASDATADYGLVFSRGDTQYVYLGQQNVDVGLHVLAGLVRIDRLAGTGTEYVCVDDNGTLKRHAAPCDN